MSKSYIKLIEDKGQILLYSNLGGGHKAMTAILKAFISNDQTIETVADELIQTDQFKVSSAIHQDAEYYYHVYPKTRRIFACEVDSEGRILLQKDHLQQQQMVRLN